MSNHVSTTVRASAEDGWLALFGAWALSLVATLAALFIGEVMGQAPCNLCWYQRVFMFPLPIMLAIALLRDDVGASRYALPLGVIGLLVAGFHVLEYAGVIPASLTPCTATGPSCSGPGMTLFGWVPIPGLSMAAFTGITALLALAQWRPRP